MNYIKYLLFFLFAFTADPYYVIVKAYDADNTNTLLNTVVFTYERETQRDSAFEDTVSYYQQISKSLGEYAFLDTTQNVLIIIDWK